MTQTKDGSSAGLVQAAKDAWQRVSASLRRYGVVAFGVSAILLLAAGVRFTIIDQFNQAEQAAHHDGANLARVFEEQIIRSIRAADQTIVYARELYARAPDKFDISLWLKNSQFVTDLSFQVAIIDRNGFLLASNIDPNSRVNLSDREHFRVHAESTEDFLFISKPVFGRVSGKWSIQLTRRIVMPDGRFGGVVVVSLDPAYLSKFYESVDIGQNGSISLIGTDGIIRAHGARGPLQIGESVAEGQLLARYAHAPNGSFYGESPLDHIMRLYTYRKVQDYPLLVVVGQAKDEIFAIAAKNRNRDIAGAALVALWILIGTALILRSQQGLAKARRAVEAELRARSEFLAVVSRDIQSPVNAMIGTATRLTKTELDKDQRQMTVALRDSADHLLQVLNDVLDFTKTDMQRYTFETIRFNLRQLARTTLDGFARTARRKAIRLDMQLAEDVPDFVIGDPARLRQVLFNLIGNAIRFTEKGTVSMAIRGTAIDDRKCRIDFEIRDTGTGIPAHALHALTWDRASAASPPPQLDASSLGLAICKRLVHGMGGMISAESDGGKGSTFRFSILVDLAYSDGAPLSEAKPLAPAAL